MALILSKTGISTGATVEASQITQSIDALTGAVAYDITISGSLTVTGSLNMNGTLNATSSNAISSSFATTASFAVSSSRAVSSSFATTASFALNGGGGAAFPYTGSASILGSLTLAGASILNLGTSSVAQQFVSFNPEGTATRTIEGAAFNGGEIAADNPVNDWLLIQYTDENKTLQTGYIPILHA
jgi:hypothetical protein